MTSEIRVTAAESGLIAKALEVRDGNRASLTRSIGQTDTASAASEVKAANTQRKRRGRLGDPVRKGIRPAAPGGGAGAGVLQFNLTEGAEWVFGEMFINDGLETLRGEVGYSFKVKFPVTIDHVGVMDPIDPRQGADPLPFIPIPPSFPWRDVTIVRIYDSGLDGELILESQAPEFSQTIWRPSARYWKLQQVLRLTPGKVYTIVEQVDKVESWPGIDLAPFVGDILSPIGQEQQLLNALNIAVCADWFDYQEPVGGNPYDVYWLSWSNTVIKAYQGIPPEQPGGILEGTAVVGGPTLAAGLRLPPRQNYLGTGQPVDAADRVAW